MDTAWCTAITHTSLTVGSLAITVASTADAVVARLSVTAPIGPTMAAGPPVSLLARSAASITEAQRGPFPLEEERASAEASTAAGVSMQAEASMEAEVTDEYHAKTKV